MWVTFDGRVRAWVGCALHQCPGLEISTVHRVGEDANIATVRVEGRRQLGAEVLCAASAGGGNEKKG